MVTLSEAVLTVMLALPQWHGDAGETTEERALLLAPIASVIATESAGNLPLAAAMIANAHHESASFARAVLEGRCHEMPAGLRCDHGRARGAWQVWRVFCPAAYAHPAGSVESLRAEGACVARGLRGGRLRCGSWEGAFASLGGGARCSSPTGARKAKAQRSAFYALHQRRREE